MIGSVNVIVFVTVNVNGIVVVNVPVRMRASVTVTVTMSVIVSRIVTVDIIVSMCGVFVVIVDVGVCGIVPVNVNMITRVAMACIGLPVAMVTANVVVNGITKVTGNVDMYASMNGNVNVCVIWCYQGECICDWEWVGDGVAECFHERYVVL